MAFCAKAIVPRSLGAIGAGIGVLVHTGAGVTETVASTPAAIVAWMSGVVLDAPNAGVKVGLSGIGSGVGAGGAESHAVSASARRMSARNASVRTGSVSDCSVAASVARGISWAGSQLLSPRSTG